MNKPLPDAECAAPLRERAEAIFRKTADQTPELAMLPEATRRVLHELGVHQIELEMQNEELRRMQEELAVSRARYFDHFDLAPVGYLTLCENGLILEANLTAANLLGLARAEMVKQPISRFIFKKDQDIHYRHRKRLLETGEPQSYELRVVKPDGTTVWAGAETTTAHGQGDQRACRVVLSDISVRKQAEAYREMGREILQVLNAPGDLLGSVEGVLAILKARTGVDAVGIRLHDGVDFPYFAQEGFPTSFLLTENTLLTRDRAGWVCRNEDDSVCLACTCGLVLSGRTDPANPLFTRGGSCWTNDSSVLQDVPPDKDPRDHPRNQCIKYGYSSVALVPIRNQNRILGLIQLNDRRRGLFTHETVEILEGIAPHLGAALTRKQAEEELSKKTAELERFTYTVSHDLKSPLVTIKTFLDYLEEDMEGPKAAVVATDLGYIRGAANKMTRLLDELLELARVGHYVNELVEMPLQEIVQEALDLVAGQIDKIGVRVEVTREPIWLYGDRFRLVEVFQNLIDNAVKFLGNQPSPRVEIGVESGDGSLVLFVRDNGKGIDPRHHSKLFGLFERLDASHPGSGMGLAMTKRIVEVHGGKIWASSPGLGHGTTFRFTLAKTKRK